MIHINLLPYRLKNEKRAQKRFYMMLLVSAALSLIVVFLVNQYYQSKLDAKKVQVAQLNAQILKMDEALKKNQQQKDVHQLVLNRINLISMLQQNRKTALLSLKRVQVVLPKDIFLTELHYKKPQLVIKGVALSRTSVSQMMRRLAKQRSFADVYLGEISHDAFVINIIVSKAVNDGSQ